MARKTVKIIVEGQTEEVFVNTLLIPAFKPLQLDLEPLIIPTSKSAKGGGATYQRVELHVRNALRAKSVDLVTTMLDFYALKGDFPGAKSLHTALKDRSPETKIQHLERSFEETINHEKFLAYFSLHEFEALLFSAPERIAAEFSQLPKPDHGAFKKVLSKYHNPEHINLDNPPKRRIESILKPHGIRYKETFNGINIAQAIGLDTMREHCRHFDEWIIRLELLAKS